MESSKAYVKKVEKAKEEDVYDILHQIEESNKSISESEMKNVIRETTNCIRKYKADKKEIIKRLMVLIASLSIFVGFTKVYESMSDKALNDSFQVVSSVTFKYNEETGYSKDEEWVPIKEANAGTYIKIYEPWNIKNEREIRTYDISSLSDMELEDYLKLNLEEMGIDYSSTMESISENGALLNEEEVKEVIKNIVFYDKTKTEEIPTVILKMIYFILLGVLIVLDHKNGDENSYFLILTNFFNMINLIQQTLYDKHCIDSKCTRNILEYTYYLTDMIKRNNELRNKFVEEFNKLECSDPSEIMEKFKRVCNMVNLREYEEENNLVLKELKKRGVI